MEIEKVYRILALAIGVMALAVLAAKIIYFPDADHHLWLLCTFIPAIVAVFTSRKKEKRERF